MTQTTFHAIDMEGKHGPTVYHEAGEHRLAALKYATRCYLLHGPLSLTYHEDGEVTVECPGLMPLTFAPDETTVH